jgi:hypothetical protein
MMTLGERFWSKCATGEANCCWQWLGTTNAQGYGRFLLLGKNRRAHRVAYLLTFGDIPNDLHVLHRCDNPGCCNPGHLFLGTNKDNSDDKIAKGRQAHVRGERNGNAVLTPAQVAIIRNSTVRSGLLAQQYGITPQHIRVIRSGKRVWL